MPESPRPLQGMRDFLPAQNLLRQWVIGELRKTFELFGFEPLDTPSLEYAETLKGKYGDEADKLIYAFEDRGGRQVGLRYDLTVPLARVVSGYPDLPRPFKRYQIANVWRAERPQKGRYREFTQCDVDIAGSSSPLADSEILALYGAGFDRLGFPEYTIRLNSRKLLTALANSVGVDGEATLALFRSLDKLDKIGEEGVRRELAERGLPVVVADRLFDLVAAGGSNDEILNRVGANLTSEGADELRQVVDGAVAAGVRPERLQLDLSVVRGLDYYTGPIYEVAVEEPRIGSLGGGGRYDGLIGMFAGRPIPCTGGSFGLDRIIHVIEELNLKPQGLTGTVTQVFVTVFGPETSGASLELARDLRAAGVRAEVALMGDKLGNQLRAAARRELPFVAIVGPDEVASGQVVVKDLRSGEQTTLSRADAPVHLARQLIG